jgi:ligand-binding sensor domain-containing protein/class 3 adenylate cyclase
MNTEMKIVFDRKIRQCIIIAFVFLLPIISGCHKNNEALDSDKYVIPMVQRLYKSNGYDTNIIKNEQIKPIIYSNGDTAITGKMLKIKIRYDSMLSSRVNKSATLGNTQIFGENTLVPLLGKELNIRFDWDYSFDHIYLDKLNNVSKGSMKNSTGKLVSTGIQKPCKLRKVHIRNSPFLPLTEPDRKDNAKYDISYFDVDQGLPISNVRDLFHDSRGYLWIATDLGVMKYDGKNLSVFSKKEGLSGNLVWGIYEDSKGNMWFTTLDGGITKYDGYSFYHLTESEGLISNRVLSAIEDNESNMWFGSDGGGLVKFSNNHITIYTSNEGLPTDYFFKISKDNSGNLWIASNGAGTIRYDGKRFSLLPKQIVGNNPYNFVALHDSKNKLWVGTYNGGLYRITDNHITHYSKSEGFIGNSIRTLSEDKEGNIWVGTTNGLAKIKDDIMQTFTQNDGLNGNSITSLSFDIERNLWLGSINGISILNPRSFRQYDLSEFIQNSTNDDIKISSILSEGNKLWLGTNKGFIKKEADHYEYTRLLDEKTSSRGIRALVKDKKGVLWLGNDFGLISYDGKIYTSYESLSLAKGIGLGKKYIRTLFSDRQGNLWIGSNGGGISIFDGQRVRVIDTQEGISSNNISAITQDNLGRMIVGTDGGGIILIDGNQFINITEKEGLSSNGIRSIAVDNNNYLWIGTDRYGLTIFDGKVFYTINEESGLSGNHVYSIMKSAENSLWVTTNKGITKIEIPKSIVPNGKIVYTKDQFILTNYDRQSGIIQKDFLINSATQDKDGNLWWGGNRKVTVLKAKYLSNVIHSNDEVGIQHLKINDSFIDYNQLSKESQYNSKAGITPFRNVPISPVFESNVRDISIIFSKQFIDKNSNNTYTYILQGYSKGWSVPSSDHIAVFNNLSPGDYEFQVRALQGQSTYGKITSYPFTILPPWWQTWWAYGLYVLLVGVSIQGIVSWRTLYLKKKQESLIRQVDEATEEIRNQKEISDSLLLNILPVSVADELKANTTYTPRYQPNVSVLFTDFKNFTEYSETISHEELVELLHDCFSQFDLLCKRHNLEKIKTIGDSFMAVGGLPVENTSHAYDCIKAGLDMIEYIDQLKPKMLTKNGKYLEIRVGIHSGPVIAGVVGLTKFQYDIWGDTVNTASRIESASDPGKVNISQTTYEMVKVSPEFNFHARGNIMTKGKGEIAMFFVSKK